MNEKLTYPSAARNAEVIIACLEKILPGEGGVLEIASGSGQHIAQLAIRHRQVQWWPSDPDERARASIEAWRHAQDSANLHPALDLDVSTPNWWAAIPGAPAGMMAINMIHIAPWQACLGLMQGAGRVLKPGGFLYLYGPFKVGGVHTAPSNEAFDQSLRGRNSQWGVRDRDDVAAAAALNGLRLADMTAMPANNFSLIFRKSPDQGAAKDAD